MSMYTRMSFVFSCVVFAAMSLIATAYADITVSEVSARALKVAAGQEAELYVKGQDLDRVIRVEFY